jgi:hypothetical protein
MCEIAWIYVNIFSDNFHFIIWFCRVEELGSTQILRLYLSGLHDLLGHTCRSPLLNHSSYIIFTHSVQSVGCERVC